MNKNKAKSLCIIFFCLTGISVLLCFTKIVLINKNTIYMFAMLAIIFAIIGFLFLLLSLKDKSQAVKKEKMPNKSISTNKNINEIINNVKLSDYDKFVEWWTSCDEKEISSNSLLFGAYQIMCFHNEICNGGFGQFFDYAEDWDWERTTKLFKWLLPKEEYKVFCDALEANKKDEDCESFNEAYNYDIMEQKVLPKLAERVVSNLKDGVTLTQYDLIEGITPYLKQKGYKKQNKRWTKNIGEFTLCFFIQGSAYDSDGYYIRPGIFVNEIKQEESSYYGHFSIDIKQTSLKQVIEDYEKFVKEWTDKALIKSRLIKFNEWEQRNPLEKRRSMTIYNSTNNIKGDVYKDDPIPEGCNVFFSVGIMLRKYILENF